MPIRKNSDWLTKLSLKDIISLGSKISAVQLFKRKSFSRRIKKGDTVWYHETLYPLLQGYDSVVMDVDLEIGGTDQTFNMLVGRELQKKINYKEKFVLTVRMIEGTDGAPMSKTRGNCIWLTDSPREMYAKVMAVIDKQIGDYFEFFTGVPLSEIRRIKNTLQNKKINPLDLKKKLALEITQQFHGKKQAEAAAKSFQRVFQQGKKPRKIKSFKTKKEQWNLVDLLVQTGLASSRSEAKRLIKQGAVEINGKRVLGPASPAGGSKSFRVLGDEVIKVGKKNWLKLVLKNEKKKEN